MPLFSVLLPCFVSQIRLFPKGLWGSHRSSSLFSGILAEFTGIQDLESSTLYLFWPDSTQDLSSLARDGIGAPCNFNAVLTTGPPEESSKFLSSQASAHFLLVRNQPLMSQSYSPRPQTELASWQDSPLTATLLHPPQDSLLTTASSWGAWSPTTSITGHLEA